MFFKKLRDYLLGWLAICLFVWCLPLHAENGCWHPTNADPYENFNRQMYQFNKGLDVAFFRPTAFLYKRIVPCPVTKMVNNFFNNLGMLTTIPNDILQGNLYHTCTDITRFVINSTFGRGGLIDVATMGGLTPHVNDTGLTFARWGYRSSNYLVLPILGPSTVRDTLGLPFDYYLFSPYQYFSITRPFRVRAALAVLYGIDRRAQLLDFDETIQQASIDPYVFIRDAYLQRRNFLIAANDDRTNNLNIQNEIILLLTMILRMFTSLGIMIRAAPMLTFMFQTMALQKHTLKSHLQHPLMTFMFLMTKTNKFSSLKPGAPQSSLVANADQ